MVFLLIYVARNLSFSNLMIQDIGGAGISVTGYNNTLTSVAVTRTGCSGIHVTGGDQVWYIISV